MSSLDDILPDVGLSTVHPQSRSIRVSGHLASAMTAHHNTGDLQSFGITFDGSYLSLGAISNLPGSPNALVSSLTPPLVQCSGSEVVPTVPLFVELDGTARNFKGFLVSLVNYITAGFDQRKETYTEFRMLWPGYREHFYGFVAAHLEFAMSALRQLGLPCSLPAFTSILHDYVQGVMTGRNHENTFRDAYDRWARRLYTPLLATAIVGNGTQAVNRARLELEGAIEILASASTRRALTDGLATNGFAINHHLHFDDDPGTQAFTYHSNRYWLEEAELDALAVLNPEPKPSAPNYQPMQVIPDVLLREIGDHLPRSSRHHARLVCDNWGVHIGR